MEELLERINASLSNFKIDEVINLLDDVALELASVMESSKRLTQYREQGFETIVLKYPDYQALNKKAKTLDALLADPDSKTEVQCMIDLLDNEDWT